MAAKPYTINAAGWFEDVFGVPVRRVDLSYLDHTRYNDGRPDGLLWHYTAGCGSDMSGNSESRGYVICCFSIDRDGVVRQYLPIDYAAWHAREASEAYCGVEHTALPGSCDLTDVELDASVKLTAALFLAIKERHGVDIPIRRVTGCDITKAGIKEHKDGAVPDHCFWNDNVHTDGLYRMTWDEYLDRVAALVGGGEGEGELDDTQAKALAQTADFVKGLVRGINGQGAGSDTPTDQLRNGYDAGQAIKGIRQWQDGFSAQRSGKPKPSDPDAAQGWTAAKST